MTNDTRKIPDHPDYGTSTHHAAISGELGAQLDDQAHRSGLSRPPPVGVRPVVELHRRCRGEKHPVQFDRLDVPHTSLVARPANAS